MPGADTFGGSLIPAISALAGVALGWFGEWLKDSRKHKRDVESLANERRHNILIKRNEEQRQTLLELHKALHRLLTAAAAANSQDQSVHSGSPSWTHNHREALVLKMSASAQTKSAMLLILVEDDEIRKLTKRQKIECALVIGAKNLNASNKSLIIAMSLFEQILDCSGVVLRTADRKIISQDEKLLSADHAEP